MNLTRSVLVVVVSSAVALGCGAAESASVDVDPAGSQGIDAEPSDFEHGVRGTLLKSVALSEHHSIDFFELDSGGTIVRETYSMDIPTEPRLLRHKHSQGMAAIFQELRPDEVVPVALLEADARDVIRKRAEAENELYASDEADEDVDVEPVRIRQAVACSADFYGDGWGGQWFLDNYCPGGPNSGRFCQANQSSYNSGAFDLQGDNTVWLQFEGDFNRAGSVMMEHRSCLLFSCTWEIDVWASVAPRKVGIWWSSHSKQKISALSPCSHLGYRFEW